MKNDVFGDRMKFYEKNNVVNIFPKGVPVVARIDGRCFSKFTKGMDRPFDTIMSNCMKATTKHLVEETGSVVGYTQSDEITLVWYCDDPKSEMWFGGKMQKMVSQLSAQSTLKFYQEVMEYVWFRDIYGPRNPTFDARVWFVPSKEEAVNSLLWREKDAVKNSISMAASCYYSSKDLHKKGAKEQQEMLHQKGVNWNDYPTHFKRGTYFKREKTLRKFNPTELSNLPEKHQARLNPELEFWRSDVKELKDYSLYKEEDPVSFLFSLTDINMF